MRILKNTLKDYYFYQVDRKTRKPLIVGEFLPYLRRIQDLRIRRIRRLKGGGIEVIDRRGHDVFLGYKDEFFIKTFNYETNNKTTIDTKRNAPISGLSDNQKDVRRDDAGTERKVLEDSGD